MTSDPERKWNKRPLSPHFSSNDRDKDRASHGPAAALGHGDIAQALLDSPDDGRTLDFSHKNLGDVGESGAEELSTIGTDDLGDECIVLRIALGYNRLATLPMAFALLARLRYLNLRANNFTTFPDVLTVMPSLEILDISRNKLKRLPSQPGTLLGLRVFSISKNRLTRLPEYISKASNLAVFQVDHNPLEWPPKHVLQPLDNADDADAMLSCIENVKKWIENHSSGSPLDRGKVSDVSRKSSDESTQGIRSNKSSDFEFTSDESDAHVNLHDEFSFSNQHSRTFSTESDVSNYSIASRESNEAEFHLPGEHDGEMTKPPPSLNFANITSLSPTASPPGSPTLPDNNIAATRDDHFFGTRHVEAQPSDLEGSIYGQQHGRNASYSVAREPNQLTSRLSVKKSLPDLRGSNITINERSRSPVPRIRMPGVTMKPVTSDSADTGARNSSQSSAPVANHSASPRHNGIPTEYTVPTQVHTLSHSRTPRSQPANNHLRGIVATAVESVPSPVVSSLQGPAPSMDVERNSYFRRLSTLPPSTVSATIPEALLVMIDSARGILFAVSQIYQSLRHYTVFAIDDRLSGLLGKVLDPASTYMAHLINALDRFDSLSRRGLPPAAICRGVLESCRDNVAVFGKVVGVLHLQLKVLAGSDDARYSRSLLLMLYGSMAEISHSWHTMMPHLSAIQPLLSEYPPPQPVMTSSKLDTMTIPNTPVARNDAPTTAEKHPSASSPIPRTPTCPQASNMTNGRSRMTRRHAGSFSTRDVQIGKSLPSATEEAITPCVPSPSSVQPLRSALRKPVATSQAFISHPHSQPSSMDSPSSTHSLQNSSSPAATGGSSLTCPLPLARQPETSNARAANSSLEVPTDSSKMVDEDLLDTMEAATETARSVWRMMDEVLHDTKETNTELLESLEWAQDITRRLKEEIRGVRSRTVDGDRRMFWEDAHHFVKAVVNVSTNLKAFSISHPFSVILRGNIAKLTQSTQDFAILLQVSSFSPAPTPGPYSPAIPATPGKQPANGPSLARARSAQGTLLPSSAKAKPPELRDVPWSALPHQTFKIPENI